MKHPNTHSNLKILPFAILWNKPMGIHDNISKIEPTATLLTSLVQIEKTRGFQKCKVHCCNLKGFKVTNLQTSAWPGFEPGPPAWGT